MSDATIPVQNPGTTDSQLDAEQLTVSAVVVKRERLQLAGAADVEIMRVKNSVPLAADYGAVVREVTAGTLTDRSGTITAGGTAQTLAAINTTRRYLFIQNLDPSEDLWLNFTTTAVIGHPSIRLAAGDTFSFEGKFVSTELVSIKAATTGHEFTAKEG